MARGAAHIGKHNYSTRIEDGGHALVGDEPTRNGGADTGPAPYDYLLAGLGACTAITLRMYADRKQWPLSDVVVRIRPVRSHAVDCADCETKDVGVGRLEREVELLGPLTEEQRARLLYIADRCPVKQTLERGLRVEAASPLTRQEVST